MLNVESLDPKDKMRSDDRILVVQQIEGVKPLSSTGLVDTRLFKGGNKLHARKSINSSLWYLEYEQGGLPEPLRQQWTSWTKMMAFVRDYFNKRGLDIVRVED